MATVQVIRHQVVDQYVNETVIVVYAMGQDPDKQVRAGNNALGLTGTTHVKVEYCYLKFEMTTESTGVHGRTPAYVYDDKRVLILAGINPTLTYREIIDLLEKLIDLRVVIYWIFREVYLSRPRSLVIGINSQSMPSIPDGPTLRKLLDTKVKWKGEADNLLFREGRRPLPTAGTPAISGITSVASATTGAPLFNLPQKSYAAATVTTNRDEGAISQEVITTMRQQFSIYSQKINQQEERLVRAEQRNAELASQMTEMRSEVQALSSENRQEISTLTRHVMGNQETLERILRAMEGPRGPAAGGNKNI